MTAEAAKDDAIRMRTNFFMEAPQMKPAEMVASTMTTLLGWFAMTQMA